MKRKERRIVIRLVVLGIIFAILKIYIFGNFYGDVYVYNIESMLFESFYGGQLTSGNISFELIGHILIIYLVINIVRAYYIEEVKKNMVYLFIRMKHRKRWFIKKNCAIFCMILCFYIVYYGMCILLASILGMKVMNSTLCIDLIKEILVVNILYLFLLVLTIHVLVLYVKEEYAKLSIIMCDCMTILLAGTLYKNMGSISKVITYIPACQNIYAYHNASNLHETMEGFMCVVDGNFTSAYSVLYCILAIVGVCIVGCKKFDKMEVL